MSAILERRGEEGLSPDWTITPVGGIGNVSTFVALIGAQDDLNVAVLTDYNRSDQQSIENLYKQKLLKQQSVHTYAEFVTGAEADIEDMFEADFYLALVNSEFNAQIAMTDLPPGGPRILSRIERHLEHSPLPKGARFNHYRPARFFNENVGTLEGNLSDATIERFTIAFKTLNTLV